MSEREHKKTFDILREEIARLTKELEEARANNESERQCCEATNRRAIAAEARLSEVEKERDASLAMSAELRRAAHEQEDRAEEAEKRVAELTRYARHEGDSRYGTLRFGGEPCDIMCPSGGDDPNCGHADPHRCTCGLDAALSTDKATKGE